jgi:hypothetical protein
LQKTLAKTVAKKNTGTHFRKTLGNCCKKHREPLQEKRTVAKKTAQAGKTPVWKYTGYRCTKKTPILSGTITFEHDLLIFVVQCQCFLYFFCCCGMGYVHKLFQT